MITNLTVTVDAGNKLPHGTVRRAPEGFAHAILLDQAGSDTKWYVIDVYGPMSNDTDAAVADWPIVYVPAPDEVWQAMNHQMSYRDHVVSSFFSDGIRLCQTCHHLSARHLKSDGGKCEDCEKHCTAFLAEAPDGNA